MNRTQSKGRTRYVPPPVLSCGASLAPDDRFCESCGATDRRVRRRGRSNPRPRLRRPTGTAGPTRAALRGLATVPPPQASTGHPEGRRPPMPTVRGVQIDDDGFCSNCGAHGRTHRSHIDRISNITLGRWGVQDIGERHRAQRGRHVGLGRRHLPPMDRAVLVVCDGVTDRTPQRPGQPGCRRGRDPPHDGGAPPQRAPVRWPGCHRIGHQHVGGRLPRPPRWRCWG